MLHENISVSVIRESIVRLEVIEQRTLHYLPSWAEDGTVTDTMMQHHSGAAQSRSHSDAMRHAAHSGESSVTTSFHYNRTESTREINSSLSGNVYPLNNPRVDKNLLVLPSCFNKLPHPVDRMLKQLPLVDGLEVNALLQFLQKILEICMVFSITDQVLLQVLSPYCKKP
jgi:hypothetical protein